MTRTLLPAIICLLLGAGCATKTDISHDPAYMKERGEYVPGASYRLVQDVRMTTLYIPFPDDSPADLPMEYSLIPLVSIDDAHEILTRGTKLRMQKIIRWEQEKEVWIFPIAEILDGPKAGTEVDLNYISGGGKINPKFLERVP